MRIVSRLMKTEIVLDSIERSEDNILMLSPPDDWNDTKVYLTPQDVVNTLRLSLNRGMIVYLLLFPFFLAAQYLRDRKDINEIIYNISYVVAAIFMGLLLFGGSSFLLEEPLTSTIVLGVLAGLFYLITISTGKSGFLYLAVPLTLVAYFILAFGQGIELRYFPRLAVGVVLTLLILGKALSHEDQGKLAQPLYHVGYLVVLFFTIYILSNARLYALEDPWGASLPLLTFAIFHFVRYLDTREVLQLYVSMVMLGSSFVFGLYGIAYLPMAYYGIAMIALSMGMILIADRYHEANGFKHVAPVYSVGILIALLAFAYAWRDLSALFLSLALLSLHFFGGAHSLGIKSSADNWGEKTFRWIEFALGNLAAGLAALLILTLGRTNWAAVIAAGVYVYLYRKTGFGREPTILVTRNQYLWVAGGFYTLFVFVVLGLLNPLQSTQLNMLLVPILLLPILLYGRWVQRQGKIGPAASIFESSLSAVVIALLLPTILGDFQVDIALIVAGIFLAFYGVFGILWKEEVLFYALPFIVSHLYYDGLIIAGVSGPAIGLLYLPMGLLAMAIALSLLRRGTGPVRTIFLAWFIFSAASILGVATDRILLFYLTAGWAAIYVLSSTVVNQSEVPQQLFRVEDHV